MANTWNSKASNGTKPRARRRSRIGLSILKFAARVSEDIHVEPEDRRHDYGERRFVVTGEVDQRVITVVWTPGGQRHRIVSAWPASNRERREYRDYRQAIDRADSSI
jgi:uncharacterized protein